MSLNLVINVKAFAPVNCMLLLPKFVEVLDLPCCLSELGHPQFWGSYCHLYVGLSLYVNLWAAHW